MQTYEMIVAIVAIVMGAGIINHWIKAKAAKGNPQLTKEFEKKVKQVDELEKRVVALEKIVTDRRHKLSDEIENL